MSKYAAIGNLLRQAGREVITLTFAEMATAVPGGLPRSAYEYEAWWRDASAHSTHVQAVSGWLTAGYRVESVNLSAQRVTFRRTAQRTPASTAQTGGQSNRSGTNVEFAPILHGLMDNRNLTRPTLARAAGRAESTINGLMTGANQPSAEILRDIAPAMQIDIEDLLVIAGLPVELPPARPVLWPDIGRLLAAASSLTPEQIDQLTQTARQLGAQASSEHPLVRLVRHRPERASTCI